MEILGPRTISLKSNKFMGSDIFPCAYFIYLTIKIRNDTELKVLKTLYSPITNRIIVYNSKWIHK